MRPRAYTSALLKESKWLMLISSSSTCTTQYNDEMKHTPEEYLQRVSEITALKGNSDRKLRDLYII
jgi:hypothetical protein